MGSNPSVSTTLVCLAVGAVGVVFAGVMLARSADVIASGTKIGGLWLGMVLLALATSLPELVTAGTAVRIGAVDLAAGDLFGSNMANMLILALINLFAGGNLFRRAALDQALTATFAISLTSIAAGFVLFSSSSVVGWVGPGSLLLFVTYVLGSRAVLRHSSGVQQTVVETEITTLPSGKGGEESETRPICGAIIRFVIGAILVSVTAPLFAVSAENAVELTGLSASFLGVLVLGVATSLPEVVTSLAAVRIKAYDLAVANLFGSNAVNMVMFLPLDLMHTSSPILASVGPVHAFTGLVSILMMSLALTAIVLRARRPANGFGPDSVLIVVTYVVALGIIMGWGG